ncbi:MAG: glycoside hydrolase family 16 protein [Bacteroidales bacterium]|nr:glycoside hydrolase family 16 protein [Bacteroidales bacterium]
MKRIDLIILFLFPTILFAQSSCINRKENNTITSVFPVKNAVAINTRGLTKVNNQSTELNYLPDNDWKIHNNYVHSNCDNYFSNNNKYWNLSNGILTLKLFDDVSYYNGYLYEYTAGVLVNEFINQRYGYFETRIRHIPNDMSGLCMSFWSSGGIWTTPTYREFDVIEHFVANSHANVYHTTSSFGARRFVDMSIYNSTDWFIFGMEWTPEEYRFYINNYLVGYATYGETCVPKELENTNFWKVWIAKLKHDTNDPSTGYPVEIDVDYIRIYKFDTQNINLDYYGTSTNFEYKIWRTIHLGDNYSADAKFNDGGRHAIRATDGYTLGAGFEVTQGTEFETIFY